jgi:quercetin dioxygenase-like cupin family protein
MEMGMKLSYRSFGAVVFVVSVFTGTVSVFAGPTIENLLSSGKTVIGQQIVYPKGKAKVTATILELAPGEAVGWNTDSVPSFHYVLEGEVTVDYGKKGVKVFKAGDSLLEAVDYPHHVSNRGTVTMRSLAVFIGTERSETVNTKTPGTSK